MTIGFGTFGVISRLKAEAVGKNSHVSDVALGMVRDMGGTPLKQKEVPLDVERDASGKFKQVIS